MKPPTTAMDWRLIHGIGVLLVLALFLWELGDVLSPLVLFLALLALLTPYSGSPFHRLLVLTTGVLMGLWMLSDLGTLLAPFVLAVVLAYILDPVVDRMERGRLPRSAAIVLLALPVLGGVTLLLVLGIPALAAQIQQLIARSPELVENLASWIEGLSAGILAVDLPFVDEEDIVRRLRALSPGTVTDFLQDKQREIGMGAWAAVLGLGRGLGTVFTIVGYLVLTPVLTFYLLRDWDGITARIAEYIPRPRYEGWMHFGREYNRLLSRYLRSQVLAAAVVGILTWLGLWIAGFPYSGLVGAVAGVFNLVPYLGLVVSLVPALIIALLSGAFLASLLKIAIVFGVVQFLDGNIIGPRIVGESVGLHPVWVILAIGVAGIFLGFVGLLLAIPGAILVKLLLQAGLARYRRSGMYVGTDPNAS
jgi:predicted PurR-regulated permease PerM